MSSPVTIRAFSEGCEARTRCFGELLGRNDLEAVVCRRYPEVARHLEWLRRYGPAALTGSGACVFCAFDRETAAQAVLAAVAADDAGLRGRGSGRGIRCTIGAD